MTEREVILLGLRSEIIEDYVGEENPDYYYALDIVNGLTLITPSKNELKGEDWYVEIFNTDPSVRFYDFAITQGLINQLMKAVVKK
jgi:hypothetical protein